MDARDIGCFVCLPLTLAALVASATLRSCPFYCQCYQDKKFPGETRVDCDYNSAVVPRLFRNVTVVKLKSNRLSALDGFAFEDAPLIRRLALYTDNLAYVNKEAFQGLYSLQSLTIASNTHVKTDSGIFIQLGNLTLISLRTGLRKIPAELCHATKLERVDLKGNSITSATFPSCAENLTSLRQIELSENSLKSVESHDFYHLRDTSISTLVARNCKLTTLPDDFFLYLHNLKTLNVAKNAMTTLPPGIFANAKYLSQLILTDTLLHGMPFEVRPPSISRLAQLDLSHNKNMNISFGNQFLNATRLQHLILNFNKIGKLEDSTFSALSQSPISTLQLKGSGIRSITIASLVPLTHLRELYVDDNQLNEKALQNISISVSDSLKHLSLRRAQVVEINNTTFSGFGSKNNLTVLDLGYVKSRLRVKANAFHLFSNLKTLSLASCQLSLDSLDQNALAGMTSLQNLLLTNNQLSSIPRTKTVGNLSSLIALDLSFNLIGFYKSGDFEGYEGLTSLRLSNNNIRVVTSAIQELHRLKELFLTKNEIGSIQSGAFQGMRDLSILRLDGNRIVNIGTTSVTLPANVLELRLDKNLNLGDTAKLTRAFNRLSQLRELNLAQCNIRTLFVGMFDNNSALTLLELSQNAISTWHPLVFRPLAALTRLYLKRNSITSINDTSFVYLISLRALDLAQNPLACTCDLIWFRQWLHNMELYLVEYDNKDSYTCSSPHEMKGVPLQKFSLSPVDCSSHVALYLAIGLPSLLVTACAMAAFVYRYWWYFRYYMFLLRSRRRQQRDELLDGEAFQFDVYVCYHSSSRRWVTEQLVPTLEDDGGLSLCLHERDWFPGYTVLDNILKSIEISRKILLVVNNGFASSEWCRRETILAYQRLKEERNNLLVMVLLESIKQANMDKMLRSLLASRTYLAWAPGAKKETRFWKALRCALLGTQHPAAEVQI